MQITASSPVIPEPTATAMAPINTTATRIIEMKGLHYHPRSKALHIRVEDPDVLRDITGFLRTMTTTGSRSDYFHENSPVLACEFLHLAIRDTFLMAHEHQDPTRNHVVQISSEREHALLELCELLSECLLHVTEIHVSRALAGFLHNRGGSWCPVGAIQMLICNQNNNKALALETLMLRNLKVYSSATDNGSAAQVLGNSVKEQSSLERFGWQQCEFVATAHNSNIDNELADHILDSMLESVAELPRLKDCVIQCPPWSPPATTRPQTLQKLLQRPSLKGLHLDGMNLQNDHLQSFLLQNASSVLLQHQPTTQLHSLSLSLHFTLETVQELANTFRQVLVHNRSNLRQVCLRLDWLGDTHNNASKSVSRQKLQALQSFQDTLARAFLPSANNYYRKDNTSSNIHRQTPQQLQLERLELVYYDDSNSNRYSARAPATAASNPLVTSPISFLRVLEQNFFLKHLRLPYCGELNPSVDLFLRLNRTGFRQQLLRLDEHDSLNRDQMQRIHTIAALCKVQERRDECWNPTCSTQMNTTALSMMYHLLREMPGMFRLDN